MVVRAVLVSLMPAGTAPMGNYKSGTILYKALFACESEVDGKWVSFGPFAAVKGEKLSDYPDISFSN